MIIGRRRNIGAGYIPKTTVYTTPNVNKINLRLLRSKYLENDPPKAILLLLFLPLSLLLLHAKGLCLRVLLTLVEKLLIIQKGRNKSATFEGIISKLYRIQGIKIIKAITIGNNSVQEKDINWS